VARELSIPCVVNTRHGSRVLRTGDRVRVDGNAGVVTILEPAPTPTGDAPAMAPAADASALAERVTADHELVVLRVLQLKGRAEAAGPAEVLELETSAVEGILNAAAKAGELKVVREKARMTPVGHARVARLLAEARTHADEDRLEELYERFHEPNDAMKELMTRWQVRDGEPNAHDDEDYDAARAAELATFHADVTGLADDLAAASPLLASYPRRLAAAADKVATGDRSFIAAPLADSYHTAWFELHDDLILLLGRTREDEAAAGRAV
jgi:pyruvate,orthophosphate dikinase